MTRRQKTVSKILEIKEFNKEQLEFEVRKALERLHVELEKLDDLERTYSRTTADFTNKQMKGTIPVHEAELFTTYMKHLCIQIDQQKELVALRRTELDTIQKAMVEAYKEQRLFEILKKKIVQEQVKEADLSEQKEADYNYLSRKAKK